MQRVIGTLEQQCGSNAQGDYEISASTRGRWLSIGRIVRFLWKTYNLAASKLPNLAVIGDRIGDKLM